MTLEEVISTLEALQSEEIEYVIYATRIDGHWTGDSPAVLVETPVYVPDDYTWPEAPEGMEYMLEASLAQEAIEAYKEQSGNLDPSLAQKVEAIIYYAEHDAYLPA